MNRKMRKLSRLINYGVQSFPDTRQLRSIDLGKAVFLSLHTPLKFRFFYRLTYVLNLLGFEVYYHLSSVESLYNLARMDGDLSLLPPIKLVFKLPKNIENSTFCSDRQDYLWTKSWKKKIYLEFDVSKPKNEVVNPLFIPFSVHDYIHRAYFSNRIELLDNPKKIRLFFSGAFEGYQGSQIQSKLGKLERQDIIEIYRNHPNTSIIESQEQLNQVLIVPATSKFYLVDPKKFRLQPSIWLDTLSYTQIFLCPPGIVNPMSYNANEAISVGTIPLINYADWFHPRLVNGQNCFEFSTKEDLVNLLDRLQFISDEELSRMRQNVIAYYELYQSDDFVVKKYHEYKKEQVVTFVMNIEQSNLSNINANSIAVSS